MLYYSMPRNIGHIFFTKYRALQFRSSILVVNEFKPIKIPDTNEIRRPPKLMLMQITEFNFCKKNV